MKLIYNRFSLIPHTCSKCEKAFWLEPYKRYKVERFSMFGNVEYVTNICKECVISKLNGENEDFDHEEFYNFLLNTIQPNEMEKYRNMFLSSGEIVN